jgi:deoxyribonuclease-4
MQVFVKNANRWESPDLEPEEVEGFCKARSSSNLKRCVAHDSYLINLASPNDALWDRSKAALFAELRRCDLLEIEHLVVHPGAHVGSGESEGIDRIAAAIDWIQAEGGDLKVKIALETTAGQGTSIGHRFEHLRDILAAVREPEKLFVCLDTCHIFAAGYDIRRQQDYRETIELFEAIIGLGKLKVIHFNDSKRDLGSRVDRHEHIGKGFIGEDGFRWFLNDPRFVEVPKILETPKGSDDSYDIDNLAVLRSLSPSCPMNG